jgi:ribosomal-protein-alanine N-acetyltransferase
MERGRLLLRPAERADVAELAEVGAAARDCKWVTAPETQDAVEQWLTRMSGERAAALVACRREDSAIVGVFNLSEIVRGAFQSSYASYYVHAAYSGNGYMTEGLRLVLQHAFGPLGLHRVESNIQPGNAASIALVRRVGFRFEGVSLRYLKIRGRWRDHERWAITTEDWRSERRQLDARRGTHTNGLMSY